MITKTKTFLLIGDWKDFDTFKKLYRQRKSLHNTKITFKRCNYWDILNAKLPKITTKEIIIFPCFPFEYWDTHIEPKNYEGVYGNSSFYTKFKSFWKAVQHNIEATYKESKISYINNPKNLATDRDKTMTKQLVVKNGVDAPKTYKTRKLSDILKLLDKGKKLFIKVRFGSMGKGITMAEKDRIRTNFRFRKGKICCRKSDYGWTFNEIKEKKAFLKELLKEDIIVEDMIDPLLINNRKFDIRFYVYKKKVLYTYCRTNESDAVTTNISQGARGEKLSYPKKLPQKQLKLAQNNAIKSIKALGLNFGGVDIMLCSDGKNAKFIEVNTFPGFPRARRFNLSRLLYDEIIKDYK